MARPQVQVTKTNGNLGATNPSEDGTSLLVANAVDNGADFSAGDLLGPFRSLADAEALNIDADYDKDNDVMLYHQIKGFYEDANNTAGTELYVLTVATSVTIDQMVDKDAAHVAPVLQQLAGKIKLLLVSWCPAVGHAPAYTDGLDTLLITAITNAKALVAYETGKKRPLQVLLEGRDIQSTYSSLKDLRAVDGPNANRVSVVVAQDPDVAAADARFANYAAVGYVGGLLAGLPVQRNIGRVKNGPIAITNPTLSDGTKVTALSDTNLDTIHDKGYIFPLTQIGKPGFYLNDDPTCAPNSDDYSSIANGRVIDKAERITIDTYTEELLDDILLNDDGTMNAAAIKDFQGKVETAIAAQMLAGQEISNVTAFVDPSQNVASTSEINVELNITPVGYARSIKVKLGFKISE